jgi:L-lactate dehydrogenase
MAVIENSKLTVVGAGSVGTAVAYAALIRGSARHIALYDVATAKVEAEVLDLAHGTQFTGSSEITGGADIAVASGSHVVVVTAGAKQKPGQSRLDLAATNAGILDDLMPKLLDVAPDAIYVIVTNPCDVLTVLAQRASGLPARRVFSSGTVLDTSRLRWKLAQRAGVSPASIHAHIVGEHGDSEFPLWSRATIGTVPILDWEADGRPRLTVTELDAIAEEVRTAAYTVIKGKGATNYAIGLSSARIVEAILNDERAVLPVSTVLAGVHGVDGVALSVPSIVSADGADPIRGFDLSPAESEAFQRSAAAVRDALEKLRP